MGVGIESGHLPAPHGPGENGRALARKHPGRHFKRSGELRQMGLLVLAQSGELHQILVIDLHAASLA